MNIIREHILNRGVFVRAIFSGFPKSVSPYWIKVLVRPVEIKGRYNLQFSYFYEQKDISKNYSDQDALFRIDELLDSSFRNIHIETTERSIHIQRTKKGKLIIGETRLSYSDEINIVHDHDKQRLLALPDALPLLQVVGIAAENGRIKAKMQKKYSQINEFLRLIDEMDAFSDFSRKSIRVVDFGCGKAYLTFALFYYLKNILKLNVTVIGVDLKMDVLEQNRKMASELGWDNLQFQYGAISDFRTEINPEIVVALHACDTATDDALAQGIRWGSKLILTAPCCQHELQEQLSQQSFPSELALVSHYGILKERIGDILTDTFRAAILQLLGYHTDVIQFVSSEHTAKNLMIRSVKTHSPGDKRRIKEYMALKKFWQVTPYLESLLGSDYSSWINGSN